MLFDRWLADTKKLQVEAYGVDYSKFNDHSELVAYIKNMHIATIAELQEALDETSWKPWATDEAFVNRELVIKELIDALHFIANMLVAVGCVDEQLDGLYKAKMTKNRERQLRAGGYRVRGEGADKCAHCRRALDDVGQSKVDPFLCTLCGDPEVVIGDE